MAHAHTKVLTDSVCHPVKYFSLALRLSVRTSKARKSSVGTGQRMSQLHLRTFLPDMFQRKINRPCSAKIQCEILERPVASDTYFGLETGNAARIPRRELTKKLAAMLFYFSGMPLLTRDAI